MKARKLMVYVDKGRDPVENLKREEDLFRGVDSGELPELVRFWVDSECLVRGRARSARYGWYDEALAQEMGVRVIERATGGGVVYHDEGNLNWSFFLRNLGRLLSPTKMFERASGHIVEALANLDLDAEFSPPNRIDVQGRKVSGMAARSTPRAYLVHGTLLIRSNLEKLNRLCIPPAGCPPVANLDEWIPEIHQLQIVRAVVEVLKESGFIVQTDG
jgi:lipoate---protein ligase